MHHQKLDKRRVNALRRVYLNGRPTQSSTGRALKTSQTTVGKYWREFDAIKEQYPDKLTDFNFFLPWHKDHRSTPRYLELLILLPTVLSEINSRQVNVREIWIAYRKVCSVGYQYDAFKNIFRKWYTDNVSPQVSGIIPALSDEVKRKLSKWRKSNDHRNWQIAVFLEMAAAGESRQAILKQIDAQETLYVRWIRTYKEKGLDGLKLARRVKSPDRQASFDLRREHLTKLIHESPKLYGLNRTSWSMLDLCKVYNQTHKPAMTYPQVKRDLKIMGYSYKRSRAELTSPDPDFRAKVTFIQNILRDLTPKQKFFSIDEFGPFSVRMKGGRTLIHKSKPAPRVPEEQKSKGFIICTAAIELSTNQVTHFYSWKKVTGEMIKLINLLLIQYQNEETLFLSWDAASWHTSKELNEHLKVCNSKSFRDQHHTPNIILAPLPSCTQYLNVIESVFAGLAKSVVHNSDYQSMDECREAIDRYFQERNAHYIEHPQRAGKKLWGKEIVVPEFNELQRAKKSGSVRGVRDADEINIRRRKK